MINRLSLKNRVLILKIIFLSTLIMFIVSSLALSHAYSLKPITTRKHVINYGELSLMPKTKFYVKPALIYDYKPYIEENEVVLNLVKDIELNISFKSIIYNNTEFGKIREQKIQYKLYGVINVGEWSKNIRMINETVVKDSSFKRRISINLSDIRSIVDKIGTETGTRSYVFKYTIYVQITSLVDYDTGKKKEYSITPKIILTFSTERNKLSVSYSDLNKEYKDERTDTQQNMVFGSYTVYDFRRLTLISTIISGTVSFFMLAIIIRNRHIGKEDELKYYIKRYKPLIINARRLSNYHKEKIYVNTMGELFKIAKAYNVPIIIDEKQCLHVILDNIVYEYCIQVKNED